jgi:hypothetical protein
MTLHYEATDTRGLSIYNDSVCILKTDDPLHLRSLCLALLLGQTQIAGVRIPDLLTMYGIIGAAVSRLKAGEAG